jgi:hypothetical protein
MTDQFPRIIPSPQLVQQWRDEWARENFCCTMEDYIAVQSALWAADAELEACVEWLISNQNPRWAFALQEGRRPKQKSKKEQALEDFNFLMSQEGLESSSLDISARARRVLQVLESLPD